MQPLPRLFRQSLRAGAAFAKAPSPTTSAFFSIRLASRTSFRSSICPQCEFRVQTRFYSVKGDGIGNEHGGDGLNGQHPRNQSPESPPRSRNDLADKPQGGHNLREDGPKSEKGSLPSHWENRRSEMSKQFSLLMDNLQSNIFIANRHLNDLTGYSAIEKLKKEISFQEDHVQHTRAHVREAKDAYSSAIGRRSASQREVNELLQRKHAWSPADLERFTSLYRSDHANERAETEAQEALVAAEREAEEAAALLSKNILSRYHEEQIWSDKIRRMSTWGTWGLMGVNVLLFLIFQIAVEPWRRKRLVKGFEEKVMDALEKERIVEPSHTVATAHHTAEISQAPTQSQQSEEELPPDIEPVQRTEPSSVPGTTATITATPPDTVSEKETQDEMQLELEPEPDPVLEPQITTILPPELSLSPDTWQQTFRDLFSSRRVTLSQRDLTTVALESAAAGAAVMGVLIAVFRPR
ncbi:sensitivity to high expression protein she9 [Ophidiomyces ophidiicola]|nr:sensitivity to high expression protein she9 [Ophidiomyces ophidiicola]